ATQQLSEWHNSVGTTAITVLTHFMSSQDDVETDEDCKNLAKNLHLKLAFLYGTVTEDSKFKQPFQSELLIQRHVYSFSRHTTTNSFLVFQMERALNIFSGDMCVSELKVNSKGKAIKVPHTMNKASGKPSSTLKVFSDTNYSEVTRGYMKSINHL
ncbi:uncharacterized protein BJ212DRAFT_1266732, partial [Suillus subaureus]